MSTPTLNSPTLSTGGAGPARDPAFAAAPSPLTSSERERLYTLAYRQGSQVKEKHFPFSGKLGGAIERGKLHCHRMGIKFVVVRPFVVDLDYQEKLKHEGRDDSNYGLE